MKRYCLIAIALLLLSGCGITLESAGHLHSNKAYTRPLVVLPYIKGTTKHFTKKLKSELEKVFIAEGVRGEFYVFEVPKKKTTNSASKTINEAINNRLDGGSRDIVIFFNLTELFFYDGALRSVTYDILGISPITQEHVWKAEFTSKSALGPSLFAPKAAKDIYKLLKIDGVL